MKDDASATGAEVPYLRYFGKSRADVGSKGNVHLRAYRKDELISKRLLKPFTSVKWL